MSLFQCENCGCCENTALTNQGYPGGHTADCFDWSYAPEFKGKQLCSACSPAKYSDGTTSRKGGKWHGQFDRVFLPKGEFFTNKRGNLEQSATGSEDYRPLRIYVDTPKEDDQP